MTRDTSDEERRAAHSTIPVRNRPSGAHALLLHTTPRVIRATTPHDEPLTPREAFVLELIDGQTRVASLIDITTLPETELLAILHRLRHQGLVTLG